MLDSSPPSPRRDAPDGPARRRDLHAAPVYGSSAPALDPHAPSAPDEASEPWAGGCPCCGEPQSAATSLGADYLACAACGTARSLVPEGRYQEGYYFHDSGLDASARARAALQVRHFERLLPSLSGIAYRHPDELRVLEFGCSKGFFVEQLLRRGHDVDGIDVSRPACESAARRGLGARCIQSHALDKVPPGIEPPYDVVAAFELLEHFDEPAEFLHAAATYARPGGWILGTTPNADSWWRRRLGPAWHGHGIPQYHRTVIGHAGFRALAARAGLGDVLTLSVTERDGSHLQHRNRAKTLAQRLGLDTQPARVGLGLALAPHQLWLERATSRYCRTDGDTLLFAVRVPA